MSKFLTLNWVAEAHTEVEETTGRNNTDTQSYYSWEGSEAKETFFFIHIVQYFVFLCFKKLESYSNLIKLAI